MEMLKKLKLNKNMKEHIVNFQTAKLAKENNFWMCPNMEYYEKNGELSHCQIYSTIWHSMNSKKYNFGEYIAPTQSLLQKWFRDEHNIVITIEFIKCPSNSFRGTITWMDRDDLFNNEKIYTNCCSKLYEECLENILVEAFRYIKKVK